MAVTGDIAEFATRATFNDLDPSVTKHIKDVLLSGLGMTLAGVNTDTGKTLIKYVKGCKAPKEAGVLGANFRTSAEYAALVNGTTSHSTELEDDTFPEGIYSVGIFPGIFALGEKLRSSGKQVIEAFAVAWDVASKLSIPAREKMGFRRGIGPAFCTIGVAAASARMLNLGIEKTVMTISIAASTANWNIIRQTGTGSHLYEAGLAGKNGISSAMLAMYGLTGQAEILEMPMGYLEGLTGESYKIPKLGDPFRVKDVGIKKYPCCYLLMHVIDGFLELKEVNKISSDDVESIQVHVSPIFASIIRFQHPKDEEEARFSLPHSIACCFLDRKPWIESYSIERVTSPQIKAFRAKVKMIVHPEWDDPKLIVGGEIPITINLKGGYEYKKVCPKPTDPIKVSDKELIDKYMKCALRVVPKSRAEKVAEMVLSLEQVKDISEIMALLTFPSKQHME